ncbi:hypothetical protein DXG01_007976 [Tephrocybe rancida]|nr:hypothetical protein DXG01_007976 [Tephrocybe rancida]
MLVQSNSDPVRPSPAPSVMSSVASSSVGNMPPRHGKKLAEVTDEAPKTNGKAAVESETSSSPKNSVVEAPAAPQNVETVAPPAKAPVARKIQGYTPFTTVTAVHQTSEPLSAENNAGPSVEPARIKRKPAAKPKRAAPAEGGDAEEDDAPAPKKRRVSGDTRSGAIKDIAELEGAIKKLQSSVNKDLKHLVQLAATLSAQLRDGGN